MLGSSDSASGKSKGAGLLLLVALSELPGAIGAMAGLARGKSFLPFECGLEPFASAPKFEILFYLVDLCDLNFAFEIVLIFAALINGVARNPGIRTTRSRPTRS